MPKKKKVEEKVIAVPVEEIEEIDVEEILDDEEVPSIPANKHKIEVCKNCGFKFDLFKFVTCPKCE